jgi:hypothetical protein
MATRRPEAMMRVNWRELGEFLVGMATLVVPALLLAAFIAVPGLLLDGTLGIVWVAGATALSLTIGIILCFVEER